jgi:hypothetical protein
MKNVLRVIAVVLAVGAIGQSVYVALYEKDALAIGPEKPGV